MLPATIRQVHVLTLKARAAALKAEQNAEYSRQVKTRLRRKSCRANAGERARKCKKENNRAEVAAQKAKLLKLLQLLSQQLAAQPAQLRTRYTS